MRESRVVALVGRHLCPLPRAAPQPAARMAPYAPPNVGNDPSTGSGQVSVPRAAAAAEMAALASSPAPSAAAAAQVGEVMAQLAALRAAAPSAELAPGDVGAGPRSLAPASSRLGEAIAGRSFLGIAQKIRRIWKLLPEQGQSLRGAILCTGQSSTVLLGAALQARRSKL